ncbi:short-chain dehydrogenase of unknown substrate specificity [Lachnospiraceae bacterium JC7]|nr:short-chain dehydrogenase of unknown substrate specificity [Lachnospiraceae bacterium JC7]
MKVAIITGATSGMGRRMAMELNDQIPNIQEFWLFGRRMERLWELERMLSKPCRLFAEDLLSDEFLPDYEKTLSKEKPEIVFLVNAAGFGKIGKIHELSLSDQLGMVDLNVRALTGICRLSLPYMAAHSRIINFASAAAFLAQPSFAVYAASKSYVLSFSRSLNEELHGTGCHATAVCPGPVKTEFFDIAETTGKIPFYKYLFMADPEKVCHKALVDSITKSDMSVYGAGMKVFMIFAKLMPTRLIFLMMRCLNFFSSPKNI